MSATEGQATVRDRPARTARGWPEDRRVGRSVCTSRAQEPEEATGLECLERLAGKGERGQRDFLHFHLPTRRRPMHGHACTPHKPTSEWSVSDGHGADYQGVSRQRVLGQLGVSLVVEVRGL